MGSKEMIVKDIIAELKKKNWLPESKDISTYLSFTFLLHKNDFARVSRGKYRVLVHPPVVHPPVVEPTTPGGTITLSRGALKIVERAAQKPRPPVRPSWRPPYGRSPPSWSFEGKASRRDDIQASRSFLMRA